MTVTMDFEKLKRVTRRTALKAGASSLLLAGTAPAIVSSRARAQSRTLKILQWKHFVPSHDLWFDAYAEEWGARNDTRVIVDHVAFAEVENLAAAEIAAQRGHDLVLFIAPTGRYEDHVIDHREIYEECAGRHGATRDFITRATYNPRTKKHFAICQAYTLPVVTYRKTLWDGVDLVPESWSDVLSGGRRIKLLHDKPVGFSLAPDHNSAHTMRAIMYSFGSSEQDADGNPTLKSKATLEAIRYVKALYEEAMVEEVLGWDNASNNRFMLSGDGCLTLDTLSIVRAGEKMQTTVADDLELAKAPRGPAGRLAPSFGFLEHVIWNFAENVEGAKRFLVDLVASSRESFVASGFQNMPAWPGAVPDLAAVVGDASDSGSAKYGLLAEAASWTTNVGHPGYTSPAISEVYDRGLIPTMFAQAATGRLTPEQALDQADLEVRRIFQEWKDRA